MQNRNHVLRYILSFFLMLAAMFFAGQHLAVAHAAGSDRIYYFNMDDNGLEGSMMLVESNGHWGLVDAGHRKAASIQGENGVYYSTTVNGLSNQVYCRNGKDVANYMINNLGVTHLDFIVGTHAHSDHVGGIPEVAATSFKDSSGRTKYLVDSNTTYYYKEYQHISDLEDDLVRYSSNSWHNQAFAYQAKTAMADRGANLVDVSKAEVIHGDPGNTYGDYITFNVGNMSFRLYNVYEQTNTGSENVNSIVTVMTNGNYSVVNLADIDTGNGAIDKTSQAIAKDFESVDIVVAGHHGYSGSNTKIMFDSLRPSFVVVPNGQDSSWLYTDGDLAAAIPYAQGLFGTVFYNLSISPYAVVTDLSGHQVYVYSVNGNGDLTNAINRVMKASNKTGWVSWMNTYETLWSYLEGGKAFNNGWKQIDGKMYFFKTDGIMETGWHRGQDTQYLDPGTGEMVVGWRLIDNKWYYFSTYDGSMQRGWQQIDKKMYFFLADGSMETGWHRGESTQYLDPGSGEMVVGWHNIEGRWHYFSLDDGAMMKLTGWQQINGKMYFLNENGNTEKGWHRGESTQYLDPDTGEMAVGWKIIDNKWYYLSTYDGSMQRGWQQINKKMYFLQADGSMETGWHRGESTQYLDPGSGEMVVGWHLIDNQWYYFSIQDGQMMTGWQKIDGRWYYFYPDNGCMARDTVIDGYYINTEGVWAA